MSLAPLSKAFIAFSFVQNMLQHDQAESGHAYRGISEDGNWLVIRAHQNRSSAGGGEWFMIADELYHKAGRSSFAPIQDCFHQAITFWTGEGEFIFGKIRNILGFDRRYMSICHNRSDCLAYQALCRRSLSLWAGRP